MIPQGKYRAVATEADFGKSAVKGTEYVRVTFRITDGEEAGQVVTWDGYFTEKTTSRTLEALALCGCMFPDNDPTDLRGLGSREVQIDVQHESYEANSGEQRTFARVAWVNPLGGVRPEQRMNDAEKASFKQRFLGAVMTLKNRKPAVQNKDGTTTVEEEVIPF